MVGLRAETAVCRAVWAKELDEVASPDDDGRDLRTAVRQRSSLLSM